MRRKIIALGSGCVAGGIAVNMAVNSHPCSRYRPLRQANSLGIESNDDDAEGNNDKNDRNDKNKNKNKSKSNDGVNADVDSVEGTRRMVGRRGDSVADLVDQHEEQKHGRSRDASKLLSDHQSQHVNTPNDPSGYSYTEGIVRDVDQGKAVTSTKHGHTDTDAGLGAGEREREGGEEAEEEEEAHHRQAYWDALQSTRLRKGFVPPRRNTRVSSPHSRLRRANTRLTSVDNVIMRYEQSLRENASLPKVFKYFASQVVDGTEYMTPADMVRAITPGVPPSSTSKPINVPSFEDEMRHLSRREVPEFFCFVEGDQGLISYGRFLTFITLLAIPERDLETAYFMSCGPNFTTPSLRSDGLTIHGFDFMMTRNIRVRGQGYDSSQHSSKSFVRYLFGPELDRTLTLDEFKKFCTELRREILKLEYLLLSDGGGDDVDSEDPNNRPTMSLAAFARSIAALVPSDYRAHLGDRANEIAFKEVPKDKFAESAVCGQPSVEDATNSDQAFHKGDNGASTNRRDCKNEDEDEDESENEEEHLVLAKDWVVTFDEFVTWRECLKQLDAMEAAVWKYSQNSFCKSNMVRSSRAVTGKALSYAQVWAIFFLFDQDDNDSLEHDNFVRLLRPYGSAADPTKEADGLGIFSLLSCLRSACSGCFRNWYDGTLESDNG